MNGCNAPTRDCEKIIHAIGYEIHETVMGDYPESVVLESSAKPSSGYRTPDIE